MNLFRRVLTYRLTLYYLAAILLAALILSVLGIVHQPATNLAFYHYHAPDMLGYELGLRAGIWRQKQLGIRLHQRADYHPDHHARGAGDPAAAAFLILVSAWAMASKYIIALDKRHLFNPAAFGAALIGIGLHRTVSWWVGENVVLLPVILLGGALVITRLRYYEMLAAYAVAVLGISVAHGSLSSAGVMHAISMIGIHSMFCFFGLVMLTEPRTAPLGRWRQIVYGALVGLLFSPFMHIGTYYFTPEVAILCGNLFTFLSNKRRVRRWVEAFA